MKKIMNLKWKDEKYIESQKNGRKGKFDKHLNNLAKERCGKICIIKNNTWKYINKEDEVLIQDEDDESIYDDMPVLTQYSVNMTKLAKEGAFDPVIGRDEETQRVLEILCRRVKNNPCLIGEPGVGKTAVIEGLAQKIVEGNIPEILKDRQIFALDLTNIIAGAKYRGEFEERLKKIIEEIKGNKKIILFIDEIHMIIGAGGAEGAIDASNILKPSLARGDIQCIGATTIDEYRKHIEKDTALERRFQPITVGEPTREETLQILKGLRDKYEAHHNVKITDEAIEAAVKLSSRYINDRFLWSIIFYLGNNVYLCIVNEIINN